MKHFPNGFESWSETYFEVVDYIVYEFNDPNSIVTQQVESEGRTSLYSFAENLTDEFEKEFQGKEWDGEWLEVVWEWLDKKLGNYEKSALLSSEIYTNVIGGDTKWTNAYCSPVLKEGDDIIIIPPDKPFSFWSIYLVSEQGFSRCVADFPKKDGELTKKLTTLIKNILKHEKEN